MRAPRRFLVLLAVLAVGGAVAACGSPGGGTTSPTPSTSGSTLSNADTLQRSLDSWIASAGLVGATAAVVTPHGRWSGAAGMDGAGAALTRTSALPIASVTKTVTGAEVLLLAQKGLIDLDAPVTVYVDVPWETHGATIRDLLGMRSGFPGLDDSVLLPMVSQDLAKRWTNAQLVALVGPRDTRVGTVHAAPTGDMSGWYNSVNFDVLAMVIEKVTGGTTASAVRHDLLAPLGLQRIWWQPDEKPEPPLAAALDDPASPLSDPASGYLPSIAWGSAMGGGGCMAADAPTLADWGSALYGGTAVPRTIVEQMTAGAAQDGYGLATMRAVEDDGQLLVGHLGDARVASSLLLHWTGSDITVVILVPQHLSTDALPTPVFAAELASLAGAAS